MQTMSQTNDPSPRNSFGAVDGRHANLDADFSQGASDRLRRRADGADDDRAGQRRPAGGGTQQPRWRRAARPLHAPGPELHVLAAAQAKT